MGIDVKSLGHEIGKMAQNVDEKEVVKAVNDVKKSADKIDNEAVKKVVSSINISEKDIKGALDTVKKL